MPVAGKRPPKKFARKILRKAEESGARDPGAVLGSIWYHRIPKSKRKAIRRREYGRRSA